MTDFEKFRRDVLRPKPRKAENSTTSQTQTSNTKPAASSKKSVARVTTTPAAAKPRPASGFDTSAYDRLYNNYAQSVNADAARQIQEAKRSADQQLRQAYITRAQNQQTLNNNLAMAGIRGGATETANIKLANQYGNSVGQINSQLASTTESINKTAAQNKLAYRQDIDAKKQQYIEDRQREARQNAREDSQLAYNRAVASNQRAYERRQAADQKAYERGQTARQQSIDYYTAWASKFMKEKDIKAEIKKAKSEKNNYKLQVLNARLGYIRENKNK